VRTHLLAWLQQWPRIEIWADCLAYDWVLFCELFGGACYLPGNIGMYPMDIAGLFACCGYAVNTPRAGFAGIAAEQSQHAHNALWDAELIRNCYRRLRDKRPVV
jgi:hypothetical protein